MIQEIWTSSNNALWVYPHWMTAIKKFAPLRPFSKETIVSEWNIWKVLSLLIYICDKLKRGNSSKGVNRNFSRLGEGCASNILDELNFMWFCGFSEWKYLGDICTLTKKLFLSLLKNRAWLASAQIFNFHSHPIHIFRL